MSGENPAPENDWSDASAGAATLELMAAWPDSIGSDEVWAEQIGRIAAAAIWPLAYRAGREDAARDIRALTVGHDEGNILHDAMNLAADVAEGKCAGGIIRLVPKGERA